MSRSTFIITALASVALIASATYALSLHRQGSAAEPLLPAERVQTAPSFDPPPPPPAAPAETAITVSAVQIVGHAPVPKAARFDCGDWETLAQGPATQHVRNCKNVYR